MHCNPANCCSARSFIIKARDAFQWIGHIGDLTSEYDQFDSWLLANSTDTQSRDTDLTYPLLDVILYILFKARLAMAAVLTIILSTILIAIRSTQFITNRWTHQLQYSRKTQDRTVLVIQTAILCTLNIVIMLTIYGPAYQAFICVSKAVIWAVAVLKLAVLSIVLLFP